MKERIIKTVPHMVYKLKHYHIDNNEKGLDVINLFTSLVNTSRGKRWIFRVKRIIVKIMLDCRVGIIKLYT